MHSIDQEPLQPGSRLFDRRSFLRGTVFAGAVLAAAGCANIFPEAPKPRAEFDIAPSWEQDFTAMPGPSIDTNVWKYDLDPDKPFYNHEEQGYTSSLDNIRIEPGVGLVIEAHEQGYRYQNDPKNRYYEYTSGRIDTHESFSFEYGKIEATMKLPQGPGTWPAFWLLSANEPNTKKYLSSPSFDQNEYEHNRRMYMKDGELDIMEHYGNTPGHIEATVHTFQHSTEGSIEVPDYSDVFHTYGVELTPSKIIWTLDGKPYDTYNKPSDNPDDWPFGHGNKFYPIFNLAMGGGTKGNRVDASQQESWRMVIRDLKFYDYTGGS